MNSGGAVHIARLARAAAMSERQLERAFDRFVGIGPKLFARIVRLDRVRGFIATPAAELVSRAPGGRRSRISLPIMGTAISRISRGSSLRWRGRESRCVRPREAGCSGRVNGAQRALA